MCGFAVDQRYQLKGLVELSDDRRGLGTKLGDGTPTSELGSRGSQGAFGGAGALRHGALRARGVLPVEAERGPDNGVELEEEKQRQDQAHDER